MAPLHHRLPVLPRLVRRSAAWLRWLARQARSIESLFVVVAILIGMGAGLLTVAQGALARTLQHIAFAMPTEWRLSGIPALSWHQLLMLPLGGGALVLFNRLVGALSLIHI